ncbi:MAG: MFS transporter [Saprospiraceae bacterium]|nr:MFS transporter [Saprospiraceae bacterium]
MNTILSFYINSFKGLSREVWTLAIVLLINRSGMMVLPFLTLYSTKDLGFTITQAGIVTGMYGAGSLAGSWLGGWLTDRVGFYPVLSRSLVLGGLGMASLLLFRDFHVLCLVIFLTSTILDASRPPLMAAVSIFSKPENQTRAIALIRMALNLGISIGPAVAGLLAGTLGYDWLFIIDGITCLLAALYLIRNLDPSQKKRPKPEIPATGAKRASSDTIYLLFLLVAAINIVAFMQIMSTAPLFFSEVMQLSETQIGLFFTFNGLLVFVFEMPLVSYSQRIWTPFKSMILGALLIGFGVLSLNLPVHWLIAITLYNVLISFGEIINFPFGNSLALTRAPAHLKGKYMGFWAMMFSSTFIIAPVLGTRLIEYFGFTVTWFVIAGLSFISIPGFIWIRNRWDREECRMSKDEGRITNQSADRPKERQ